LRVDLVGRRCEALQNGRGARGQQLTPLPRDGGAGADRLGVAALAVAVIEIVSSSSLVRR
jgi:hypothetical protein